MHTRIRLSCVASRSHWVACRIVARIGVFRPLVLAFVAAGAMYAVGCRQGLLYSDRRPIVLNAGAAFGIRKHETTETRTDNIRKPKDTKTRE